MSSKIKVDTIENVAGSGNVSLGSGHNLVVPGDLAVDTNVLKVDSSNNKVGINTTSPSNDLHISSTNPVIRLQDTSTNAYAQIFTNDAGSMRLRADAGNSQASSNFILEIDGTTQLSVDSSGRVLKPNQPYFAAHMTGNSTYQTRGSGAVFPFNTTVYNVGSHFDTSNYRFTAPVDGKYLFTASFITNDSTPEGRITFYVNGSQNVSNLQFGINGSNTGGGGGTNASAIIQLSASDYVDVRSQSGTTQFYEDNHSSFTGILLA